MLLKTILAMGVALLLMGLFTTWAYRKLHAGRDGEVAPAAIAPQFKPPLAPIEMRPRIFVSEGNLGLAITLSILAVFLFTRDGLWLRLLAWPVGGLVLLFASMSFWDVWNESGTRFLADAAGMQIHDRMDVKTVPWSRVAKVKLRKVWASNGSTKVFASKSVISRSLDLLDADGTRLLRLALPLKPAEASAAFEASVPVWTQRAFEVEDVNK